ncbi:MAG: alpha/beta hydrolase [Patescibacteria group bacterium]
MDTLIILHGWQSSKEKWQKVKEMLESLDLKVVALDLPGFKPENQLSRPWNLNDYVAWLENLLIAYPEPVYLLGHSFGGRIAIKLAAKNPTKLKGLILVAAAGIKNRSLSIRFWRQLAKTFSPRANSIAKRFLYHFILRKKDYLEAQGHLKQTMANAITEDLTPLLKTIITPALLVWGKKDTLTPIKDAYLMNKEIKNSRLEVLPQNGHSLHLQCPEVLAQKIKKFIDTNNHGTNS